MQNKYTPNIRQIEIKQKSNIMKQKSKKTSRTQIEIKKKFTKPLEIKQNSKRNV